MEQPQQPQKLVFLCNNFWQSLAQHHVDLPHETQHLYDASPFVPEDVRDGDVVFVKTDLLDLFCGRLLRRITARFVLITGHSDLSPSDDARAVLHLDARVLRWYAANATWRDHKTIPIPIGLSEPDRPIGDQRQVQAQVLARAHAHEGRLCKALFPAMDINCDVRAELQHLRHPELVRSETKQPYGQYLATLAKHRFALCPRGGGIDVHRVHEAILVRTVPIYISDYVPVLFGDLPIVVVQSIPHLTRVLDNLHEVAKAFETVDWEEVQKYLYVDRVPGMYGLTKR